MCDLRNLGSVGAVTTDPEAAAEGGGPNPKQVLPVPPGGERQDPRVEAMHKRFLDFADGMVLKPGAPYTPSLYATLADLLDVADSVPAGGAPREKVADALYGHLGDFSTYEKCLELADAAIAAMRGSE